MKSSKTSRIEGYGIVILILAAIALTYAICNLPEVQAESSDCEAFEVFRWSDRACYVPQGE
jgi:hypothetical protein